MQNSKQNKPLVEHIYTADPSAHVFEGKLYIYPSHDLDNDVSDSVEGDHYAMEDYHVFSMEDIEEPCTNHGQVLHMKDVPWVSKQMWAPDAAFKNDKYYLYFPARDKEGIFRIGVAVSDKPYGPFKAEPNYIEGSYSIDPAVFMDDDGTAYMYVGGLWGGQLEKWQTGEFLKDAEEPQATEPAVKPYVAILSEDMLSFNSKTMPIEILDENGQPLKVGDKDRRYFEGPWMHKFNDKYYLSYSTGETHYLVYAEGKSPLGPFTYKGRILEPVIGWTTHHSIVEFKGKWYLFYHDASLSGGIDYKRCIKFVELEIAEDGTIKTINPYS
ncbi:MAG: glycoside hydrolase family 43 protein [Defluviitaleaceae bacterium]|nr:glycoside hydrolase family 43 protein [Defluviitaleaceae bacterium]